MKPRFEKHDNQLFRMLDKPVPLTPDAKFPCLCALTSFGEEGKCNIEKLGERRKDTANLIMANSINMCKSSSQYAFVDGYMMNDKEDDFILQYYRFEIIGYPVEEGSHWWALCQMMQGEWVYNPSLEKHKSDKLDTRYLHAYGKFGQDIVVKNTLTGIDSILGAANISHWTNYAEPSGWQIYKEPESSVDPKERPLRNLILQAKEEGKNIRSFYQNLIFTPNALTDLLANNMFRWWYIGNWELTDEEQNYYPQIKLVSSEPETAKEQFEVGDCRIEFVKQELHNLLDKL